MASQPDLSDGLCMPGRSWLPAEAWTDRGAGRELREAAVRTCRSCPVLEACRAWALAVVPYSDYAIVGGLTQADRRKARRARR